MKIMRAGNTVGLEEVKIEMYGLVRDKNGKPKIDGDPKDLHPSIKAALTPAERAEFGIEEPHADINYSS